MIDYYKIVSESYERYDVNLVKKVSEWFILSILLMLVDGFYIFINLVELFDILFNSFLLLYYLQWVSVLYINNLYIMFFIVWFFFYIFNSNIWFFCNVF